jgi:uncharacterized protein
MILELEKLPADHSRLTGDEVVRFRDVGGEDSRVDCHVELDVNRIGDTFYVDVALTGYIPTSCHRCLKEFRYRITPSFTVVIRRSREMPDRDGEGDDDFVTIPYGTTEFSLDRHIYENVVVDIPMQIVCDDNCRGLCTVCGTNLNEGTCDCQKAADPRWNQLRKLNDTP